MATKFKKGDMVTIHSVPPTGPVESLRMLDDGTVQCLVTWTDVAGIEQTRWFNEDDLTAA